MKILEGKSVANKIKSTFEERIKKLEKKPHIAVLAIKGNNASDVYIKKIAKNCEAYGIGFTLKIADTEEEFEKNFQEVKNDDLITGIMFQQPLPKKLLALIDKVPAKLDIEGIGIENMGKLFLEHEDAIIPCTSKAVMETLNYYNIDLAGKKVVIVGRSNIVGKPLIPQVLAKDATVTICHSKTQNIEKELITADVIIIAIGNARFLKKYHIKENAILIDVGINVEDDRIVGDVDFEDIKDKASMCTPVPGGIGVVTNAILVDNIIKACEI